MRPEYHDRRCSASIPRGHSYQRGDHGYQRGDNLRRAVSGCVMRLGFLGRPVLLNDGGWRWRFALLTDRIALFIANAGRRCDCAPRP